MGVFSKKLAKTQGDAKFEKFDGGDQKASRFELLSSGNGALGRRKKQQGKQNKEWKDGRKKDEMNKPYPTNASYLVQLSYTREKRKRRKPKRKYRQTKVHTEPKVSFPMKAGDKYAS